MKFPAPILCMIALANCGPTVPVVVDAYSSSPRQTIASLGYTPVTLPSTAFGPGTLVTSIKGTGLTAPLNLTYLCRPEYTVIPPLIVDDAASAQVSHALSGTFSLDTAIVKGIGIKLGANASYVTSISVSFDNVKVEQLAFDDLRFQFLGLGADLRTFDIMLGQVAMNRGVTSVIVIPPARSQPLIVA